MKPVMYWWQAPLMLRLDFDQAKQQALLDGHIGAWWKLWSWSNWAHWEGC